MPCGLRPGADGLLGAHTLDSAAMARNYDGDTRRCRASGRGPMGFWVPTPLIPPRWRVTTTVAPGGAVRPLAGGRGFMGARALDSATAVRNHDGVVRRCRAASGRGPMGRGRPHSSSRRGGAQPPWTRPAVPYGPQAGSAPPKCRRCGRPPPRRKRARARPAGARTPGCSPDPHRRAQRPSHRRRSSVAAPRAAWPGSGRRRTGPSRRRRGRRSSPRRAAASC